MLRRMKKDVESQLPRKSEMVLKVALSGWQKLLYTQLKHKGLAGADASGKTTFTSMNNVVMQLRKICNHPYLFWQEGNGLTFPSENLYRSSGKFELLDRMLPKLHATKHKVLIFTQMTKILDLMEDYLRWRRWNFVRLDGATKADERGAVVDSFTNTEADNWIFLLTTRAGGVGLNLQVADTVIIFDSDWNPQMDMQAMDRAHRIGQQSEVRVYRMITNTPIEEEIFTRAKAKKTVNQIVVRETGEDETDRQNRLRQLLAEEIEAEGEDEGDAQDAGVMSWEDINNMLARSDDEIKLFETIDKEIVQRDQSEWDARETAGAEWPGRLMSDKELPSWMLNGQGADAEGDHSSHAEPTGLIMEQPGKRKTRDVSYKPQSNAEFNKMLTEAPARKRAKGSPSIDKAMRDHLLRIWHAVATASQTGLFTQLPRKKECDPGPVSRCESCETLVCVVNAKGQLTALPPRLPDYFQIIQKPISLKEIRQAINTGKYSSVRDLKVRATPMPSAVLTWCVLFNQNLW